MAVPIPMKLPGDTLRSPTTPENGALIWCLERRTRCSSKSARAISNLVEASSRAFSVTKPPGESFLVRSLFASASSKRAFALATSASARSSSSLTSTSPAATVPPSVKLISSMRPAISEAICTDSSECRLPMARISVVVIAPRATAASTATARSDARLPPPFSAVPLTGSAAARGDGFVTARTAAQATIPTAPTSTAARTNCLGRMQSAPSCP